MPIGGMPSARAVVEPGQTPPATRRDAANAPDFPLVVMRLLAIAMSGAACRSDEVLDRPLPGPVEYRSWPMLNTEAPQDSGPTSFMLYVCPKGATRREDETFPVGTWLVVETYRAKGRGAAANAAKGAGERELVRVFMMKKYASLERHGRVHVERGAWVCATYGSEATPLVETLVKGRACHAPLV